MDINTNTSPVTLNPLEGNQQKLNTPVGKVELVASVVSPSREAQQEVSKEVLNKVESVNSKLDQSKLGLTFLVDENTRSSVVKVIDKTTDEVIRQFPTEGSLKIMSNIQSYLNSIQQNDYPTKEGLTGLLLNEII